MRHCDAAELALKSIAYEREAVKHCGAPDGLSNPEYIRLMELSQKTKFAAQQYLEQNPHDKVI